MLPPEPKRQRVIECGYMRSVICRIFRQVCCIFCQTKRHRIGDLHTKKYADGRNCSETQIGDLHTKEHVVTDGRSCSETPLSILTTTRSWPNAPSDLISSIANGLGLIDLLSFRFVCKDWHLASPTSSAEIKSHPWLLLCNEGSTNCILYNVTQKNKYNINLPELQGTICLASNQGWLLLSRGSSIFFFCPFSRSKIDLPEYPHTKLVDHVAAFSSPPTCQDCVVSIINRCDEKRLELNVIHRGENTWTTHTYDRRDGEGSIGAITCGTYCEQVFYFVDKEVMALITFSPKNDEVKPYKIVKNNNPNTERMPFVSRRRHFLDTDMKFLLKLEGNVAVSTCGTMIRAEKRDIFIHNEDTKAVSEGSKTCHMRGIWIHPRFLQVPASQGWSI